MRATALAAGLLLLCAAPAGSSLVPIHLSSDMQGVLAPTPVPVELHQDHEISMGLLYGRHEATMHVASEPVQYQDGRAHAGFYGMGYRSTVDPAAGDVVWFLSTAPDALPITLTMQAVLQEPGQAPEEQGRGATTYASGSLGPVTLAPADGEEVDGRIVHRFDIPLEWLEPSIPNRGFELRIVTDVEMPAHALADLAVHTSPGHRPGLELVWLEPLRIEYIHPQWPADGTLVVHVAAQTPWGAHGIETFDVTAEGPDGPLQVEVLHAEPRGHCHCPPDPRTATFLLEDASAVRPITWDIVVRAWGGASAEAGLVLREGRATLDLQGHRHELSIDGPDGHDAPAASAAAMAVIVLVGSAATLSRRTDS